MTKTERQLLLKDLCSRLPYGVKVRLVYDENTTEVRELGLGSLHDIMFNSAEGLPYLRPMSSMTEEEDKEYRNIDNRSYSCLKDYAHIPAKDRIDWLNKKMFDYRGLIPMGLALKALEGMYNN